MGTPPNSAGAVERMRVTRKARAAQFAANVLTIIWDIQAAGHTSLSAMAERLTRNGFAAIPRRYRWYEVDGACL